MKSPHKTRDAYRRIAFCYDLLEWFLKPGRDAVTRAVGAAGRRRVLDVCCGTGTQVLALRTAGIRAVGVDLSEGMLRRARAKTNAHPGFLQADAARLPFPDRCFDALIFSFALHEKPPAERAAILAEGHRVLDAEGILFVFDYAAPGPHQPSFFRGVITAVERLTGAAHYRAFCDYLRRGGTESVLHSHGVRVLSRTLFFRGTVGLYVGRTATAAKATPPAGCEDGSFL